MYRLEFGAQLYVCTIRNRSRIVGTQNISVSREIFGCQMIIYICVQDCMLIRASIICIINGFERETTHTFAY